jgi:hypothetical protein
LLVHIASNKGESKSLFFGGLTNFLFYVAGIATQFFPQFIGVTRRAGSSSNPASVFRISHKFIDLGSMLYIAIFLTLGMLLANIFAKGFTSALHRLEAMKFASFTLEGFRHTQIHFGGFLAAGSRLFILLFGFSSRLLSTRRFVRDCDLRGRAISWHSNAALPYLWPFLRLSDFQNRRCDGA